MQAPLDIKIMILPSITQIRGFFWMYQVSVIPSEKYITGKKEFR
jgi:hypothetical protein